MKKRNRHQIKKKKSILKNRFFLSGVLIFFLLVLASYFLFFSDFFKVKEIIVKGGEKVPEKEVSLIIERKLEERILFLERKNIFLIDLKKAKKDILNTFSQIAEVNLRRDFPNTLNVIIKERKPIALWIEEKQIFFLDKKGVIFEEVFEEFDFVKIKSIQFSEEEKKLGEKVIEKELLSQVLEINKELKIILQVLPQYFLIMAEDRINIKTLEGWEIFFDPQKDIDWQLAKLKAVLEEEIPPEKRRNLEYIELRFGNLAPVKYRGQ